LDCTVTVGEAALGSHMRFAGDDATRLAAIGRAAASHADVAMIARGGYGLTRLLADLPYEAIAKSAAHGTRWVGLSDFTAFQAAVYVNTGTVTWQGPDVVADFGRADGPDEIMQACFEDLLLSQGEGTGWRLQASEARPEGWETAGRLWGGNLSMLCGLLGTPYFPSIKGGILFLEDVGEHPYRIERMLTQLLHAGVLGRQKAVLLGQFTHYKLVAGHDKGLVHPLQTGGRARQRFQAGHCGRSVAQPNCSAGFHRPAVWSCGDQSVAAIRRPGRSVCAGPRCDGAVGTHERSHPLRR